MMEDGETTNKMAMLIFQIEMELKEMANGKKEKESNGLVLLMIQGILYKLITNLMLLNLLLLFQLLSILHKTKSTSSKTSVNNGKKQENGVALLNNRKKLKKKDKRFLTTLMN